MGAKPRISDLARRVEEAEDRVAAEQTELARMRGELRTALNLTSVLSTAVPQVGSVDRPRRSRRGRDWTAARDALLAAMKPDQHYTGAELRALAPSSLVMATYLRRIRNPLLAEGRIRKMSKDGTPWRRGMSPRSVRWIRV